MEVFLPPEDDTVSLPAETERASRGSEEPPNLLDVCDNLMPPNQYKTAPDPTPVEFGDDKDTEDVLVTNKTSHDNEIPENSSPQPNTDDEQVASKEDIYTDNHVSDNASVNDSVVKNGTAINEKDEASVKQKHVTISFKDDLDVLNKETKPNVTQDKQMEEGEIKEKTETKPRLLILDMSGEGAVYSLRLDPVKERLVVGKTVEPEYWRPIRALKDYGVVVFENELYIIGGLSLEDRKCSTNVNKLNPVANQWQSMAPINVGRCKFSAAAVSGKIFIAGGEKSDGKATASCEIYDPEVDQWSKAGMLPAPRKSHALAVDGNVMYISGGILGKAAQKNIWIFENYGWHELDNDYPQELDHALERHLMVFNENTLFFIGGMQHTSTDEADSSNDPQCLSRVLAFKPTVLASNKENRHDLICPWTWQLRDMLTPRHSAGHFFLGHKLFVVGGRRTERDAGNCNIDCYDTKTDTWSTWFTMPNTMFKSAACAVMEFPPKKKQEAMRWDRAQSAATSDTSAADVYNYVKRWVFW